MTNLIGQSLGRYHILEQLGEGGMATVYKAHDTRLERDVAVKVIRNDVFGPALLEHMLKRFEREAKSLAKLSDSNIVKVLDYGEHEGAPYLVMEYLPGGTLKEKLAEGRLPWNASVRLLLPIAKALAYAHSNGIIHRDIKPSNILITQSGEPMLSDFGIAKILEGEQTTELTATGAGIGTPEYMAPEQGMGQADERADIYALGIVLYQMVTGHVPFRADTPMAVLLKKSTEPLPRPKQFIPDLPDAVENVLIKSLARSPENRYQTTRELVFALQRLLEGGQTANTTFPTATETTPEPITSTFAEESTGTTSQPVIKRSNKWMWIGAGTVALIVMLICIVAGIALASGLLGGGLLSPEPTRTPFESALAPTFTREAPPVTEYVPPTEVPPTLPPPTSVPPTAVPPTQAPVFSNPADFARWYFDALWTDRNYEYLWNTCLTPSFQNHSTEGKGYSDFVNWWSSVRQIDLLSVDVLQNDGKYAWIRVVVTFYLNDGRTLSQRSYDYNLTWNSSTSIWMFDYR